MRNGSTKEHKRKEHHTEASASRDKTIFNQQEWKSFTDVFNNHLGGAKYEVTQLYAIENHHFVNTFTTEIEKLAVKMERNPNLFKKSTHEQKNDQEWRKWVLDK